MTEHISEQLLIDPQSFRLAELDKLEAAFPTQTRVGKAWLGHVMRHGLPTTCDINLHQEAVDELTDNRTLHETLTYGLNSFAGHEKAFTSFTEAEYNSNTSVIYHDMRRGAAALRQLAAIDPQSVDAPKTPFLKTEFERLRTFADSDVSKRMEGPLYYTLGGLRGKEELSWWMPRLRFRPGYSGRIGVAGGLLAAGEVSNVLPPSMAVYNAGVVMAGMMGMMITTEGQGHHRLKDFIWSKPTAYRPLRRQMQESDAFSGLLPAVATLDVAAATAAFKKNMTLRGHKMSNPIFYPHAGQGSYALSAIGLKNPLLAIEKAASNDTTPIIANDVAIGDDKARLIFLTGPNSGGKSTLAKAIVQNQILGQMGAPMMAKSALATLADTISYQAPMPPDLDDGTGRFGFELRRVRETLDNISRMSLVVMDDCLDGTTHEERLEVLANVMQLFRHLGGATLFSTHAHELVSQFVDESDTQLLQVTFADDKPTHQIAPGISRTSHANKVAQRYGFTPAQVAEEIRHKTGRPF